MHDKRGYRQCVRVVIVKGDQVLIGKKIIDGKFVCYEFPGGGIEGNDTPEETVFKEMLEEVGIRVKDIVKLPLEFKYEINYPNPERAKLYRGGQDNWYMATFDRYDRSKHGSEDDSLPYKWYDIDDSIDVINNGPESDYNPSRIQALTVVATYMADTKRRTVPLSKEW